MFQRWCSISQPAFSCVSINSFLPRWLLKTQTDKTGNLFHVCDCAWPESWSEVLLFIVLGADHLNFRGGVSPTYKLTHSPMQPGVLLVYDSRGWVLHPSSQRPPKYTWLCWSDVTCPWGQLSIRLMMNVHQDQEVRIRGPCEVWCREKDEMSSCENTRKDLGIEGRKRKKLGEVLNTRALIIRERQINTSVHVSSKTILFRKTNVSHQNYLHMARKLSVKV